MNMHTHHIFILSLPLAEAIHPGFLQRLLTPHLNDPRKTCDLIPAAGLKPCFSYLFSLIHEKLEIIVLREGPLPAMM